MLIIACGRLPGAGNRALSPYWKEMLRRIPRLFWIALPLAWLVYFYAIGAAGLRWNIEDDNKTGKDQLGPDAYRVRKWTPWHRHVIICMPAHAFLAVIRAGLGKDHQPPSPQPIR